ncbi:MAG: PQQ-like beta-propeller repeat protein [Spirochaetales bacterium]|nr:PQQ-like beta-propeller repeat protein [Spirochaetales bacterium]
MTSVGKFKKWYILPIFIIAALFYYVFAAIPFGTYNMLPAKEVPVEEGKFSYGVPLDPESPWPKFRANELQNGRTAVIPKITNRTPWEFRTGKGIFSSAVVDKEGTVYIGSADHYFYAIGVDGKLKWKTATGEVIDSSALLDDQGRVYFGSGDAHLYALDRRNGKVLWKFKAHTVQEVKEEFGVKTYNVDWFEGNVAMLKDGTLLVPNDNYLAYAVDRNNGERKTVFVGNEMIWSLPAVNTQTGRIFHGSQYIALKNVFAYDAQTGESIWTAGGWGSNAASPLLTSNDPDGALILGGYDGIVRAYAQANGKQLWKFGTRDHIYSSPAQQSDGNIIQPSADGTVYALGPDGQQIWAFDTLEPIRSSPAIDGNGIIYVGSGEGKLFAINPDGKLRWAYQCIQEDRNDLNGSPGLGHDGIYIAGENGGIFFVPYDYPLTPAGRRDPRSTIGPGEILPAEGVFMVWTTPFGGLPVEPPEEIAANEPLTFTLFVRKNGDTVLSALDAESLQVSLSGDPKTLVQVAANRRFVTIVPQEKWIGPEGGALSVTLKGDYITDLSRFGLKFFGGRKGGSYEKTFTFNVGARNSGDMPYQIPARTGDPSTVLELSRLAAPNPTMLPSWNQIGFDSLHYLAGFVEGQGKNAILWVVPGKLDGAIGKTVVAPDLKDRFVLNLDYDGGLLTLFYYKSFLLSFIGSWDMPFGLYRVATQVHPEKGHVLNGAAMNALVLGDDLEFYGKFLKIMGLTDFSTGHMPVFGGMNMSLWGSGSVTGPDPDQIGQAKITCSDTSASVDIVGGKLKEEEHVFGLLLVDASTGKPIKADYARGMKIGKDSAGNVNKVTVTYEPGSVKGLVRAYYMVDTYPAYRQEIEAK